MRYRLDDLIREGIKISGRTNTVLVRNKEEEILSCAYGAAELGIRKKTNTLDSINSDICLHNANESLTKIAKNKEIAYKDFPKQVKDYNPQKDYLGLYEVVYSMNDYFRMSREAVAEYISWLIDEKGYDLTIDLSPDEDDEEEEERELQPA
jgi:hypothetical protein